MLNKKNWKTMKKQDAESLSPDRPISIDLSEVFGPVLTLTMQLRQARDFGNPGILRQRVRELLERTEREAQKIGFAQADIRSAEFALVAFLDETIIASEWNQKDEWLTRPLQLELFDRFDAGEEFFTKLDRLRQRPLDNLSLLRVYYLCLALGFRGKYQVLERDKIRQLIEDIYAEIAHLQRKPVHDLSPHGQRRDEIVDVVVREVPPWIIGVFALAGGFFFYLVMSFLISRSADEVVQIFKNTL
jgi:type VI secretion system protein ImpK